MAKLPPIDQPIHFIGIGGVGMSALALILNENGYLISGSDKKTPNTIKNLEKNQIRIFPEQSTENICSLVEESKILPLIVISTAIKDSNEELQAAHKAGLRVIHRSDLLAALIEQKESIVVAGSHGKTTTSTIITTLLALSKQDPTAVIGGIVPHYNSNGHSGKSQFLVAEADESDGSLIKFHSSIGVLTNLELEHTEHYENINQLISTLQKFSNASKTLIANFDCAIVKKNFKANYWWSIETIEDINYAAIPVSCESDKTIANYYENGTFIEQLTIPLPGLHNLSNVTAAIGACRISGLKFSQIKENLLSIRSPGRRFQVRGVWQNRLIIDDYAHHPTEIKATISTALNIINNKKQSNFPIQAKRLVIVFQPHRYSRTKHFLKQFANSLKTADLIILAPIYSAGEDYIKNANSYAIKRELIKTNANTFVGNTLNKVADIIEEKSHADDLVLILGAGNVNQTWNLLNNKEVGKPCIQMNQAA